MKKFLLYVLLALFFIETSAQIGFQEYVLPSGRAPFTISDIDNDGDLDIVTSESMDNFLVWYENINGNGVFGPANQIAQYQGESRIITVDLDSDSDMDIVICSVTNNSIRWYENLDGLGGFSSPNLIDNYVPDVSDIYAGDIDGDFDIDIVSSNRFNDELIWHENIDNYLNALDRPIHLISENLSNPTTVRLLDVDGDSDLDLVSTSISGNELVLYENTDGIGNFNEGTTIDSGLSQVYDCYIADMDGDLDLDILVPSYFNKTFYWYENIDGQANFSAKREIGTTQGYASEIYSADIDGDGDNDVITGSGGSSSDTEISWFENIDGMGNFGFQQIINSGYINPKELVCEDLNGDEKIDVVVTFNDGNFLWNKNLGFTQNEIQGFVRYDLDSDGCDNNDFNVPNIMVSSEINGEIKSVYTLESGFYQFFSGIGENTVAVSANLPEYYTVSPVSQTIGFVDTGSLEVVDFCIMSNQDISDLNVVLLPTSECRAGFDVSYELVFKNIGTTQLSGDLVLQFDQNLDFLSSSELIINQGTDFVQFAFNDLLPFESRTISLLFKIPSPPTVELDDILDFTATINPILGDNNEDDNIYTLGQTVIGSYDPNDITVLEGEEVLIDDATNYLNYVIRFQNTGTASAINVKIDHELDANLDWETLIPISSSHSNTITINNGNDVEFLFNDINLPDSVSNEPDSHGYVAFKVKPKASIVIGDIVHGTASIFFDFNLPIFTNTVSTHFTEQSLGISEQNINQKIRLYPSPSSQQISVKHEGLISRYKIFNTTGQLCIEKEAVGEIEKIDIRKLSQGVYFIKLIDINQKELVLRFIKN